MTTPVADFLREYAARRTLRLHMPGHKGTGSEGEPFDLTEVEGADVLYREEGILAESQENARRLFGSGRTLYSTEGSSLAIRAMLMLTVLYARSKGETPQILAARNAHKVFFTASALLNIDVELLAVGDSLMSATVTAEALHRALSEGTRPTAVYLTSPDYLGNRLDIRALAEVCHRFGCLLLVDNAHGAYLKFLPEDRHPMTLGADLCCDSAHKTLHALTGAAYLHVSANAPALLREEAPRAMATFASTSPSYLILRSLDLLNGTLSRDYPKRLAAFCEQVAALKERLSAQGYTLVGDEPLKLTLLTGGYGYRGEELASLLRSRGIECELADPDYTVLMLTPSLTEGDLDVLADALLSVPRREPRAEELPSMPRNAERVLSPRDALLSPSECLPIEECRGRILADPSVSCPPAVPILLCGERVTDGAIRAFRYYGITHCRVVAGDA